MIAMDTNTAKIAMMSTVKGYNKLIFKTIDFMLTNGMDSNIDKVMAQWYEVRYTIVHELIVDSVES